MNNIAIVFAGGTGSRMNIKSKPKQFLELYSKPIIVHTLEKFNTHPQIHGIILVVLEDWIPYCIELKARFGLHKVIATVAGGKTAFQSQRNGLRKAAELFPLNSIVLIHDGVRPLIDGETISNNIKCVHEHGVAITVSPAVETIMVKKDAREVGQIIERSSVEMARAPQGFVLEDILEAHRRAECDRLEFIDSASLMMHYGYRIYTVEGSPENIKITTPSDFFTFKALIDSRENSQVFGV